MNIVKDWIVNWAKVPQTNVEAVICFGSLARGDAAPSSDIDLCILGKDISSEKLKQDLMTFFIDSICYTRKEANKLIAFLSPVGREETLVRLDCFIVNSLDLVEKYIVGSELSIASMNKILLYKSDDSNCDEWLKDIIANISPVPDLVGFAKQFIINFIESFEVASNKRAVGDKSLFFFQLFIAHNSMLKLEFIRHGGRKFLYQPKMLFPFLDSFMHPTGVTVRRHFEDVLEPRGQLKHGHALQIKYLEQFQITVEALVKQNPAYLQDTAPSVNAIINMLTKILKRDRYYNFRDAAQGNMKIGTVYRSGFFELHNIINDYHIASVLDLRTQQESDKEPGNVKDCESVVRMRVDLLRCGQDTDDDTFASCAPADSTMYQPYMSKTGRFALGLALRAILHAPLPLLIHCVAGKDRTAVIIVLLQLLCGGTKDEVIRDYLRSLQDVTVAKITSYLDEVSESVSDFLLSCGLTLSEITALQHKINDNFDTNKVKRAALSVEFLFRPGHPLVPCRPFLACELQTMKSSMLANVPIQQELPWAVIITGLPGSGKSTLIETVLTKLQKNPGDSVNIDMDLVRSFHCQYQYYRHQRGEAENEDGRSMFWSYEELVPWFNRGTNIEQILYSAPNGVVQSLLQNRCNFILPCVMDNERTLQFLRHVVENKGYFPVLIGVHVTEDIAISRVLNRRNQMTGRYMPVSLILGRTEAIQAAFANTAQFVIDHAGSVYLYNNEGKPTAAARGEIIVPPIEVFRHHEGIREVYNVKLAEEYGLINLVPEPCFLPIVPEQTKKKTENAFHAQSISDADRYQSDGFVLLQGSVNASSTAQLGIDFEDSITTTFAPDNELTREEYLSVINKWPQCNKKVMEIMLQLSNQLRHQVAAVLESEVAWPVGAVIFRKTSAMEESGNTRTHAHQDISYARFPGSQLFRATTWVPLVHQNGDTLCFAKGSHKLGIANVEDFLSTDTNKPQQVAVECDEVVHVTVGDCILFDARIYHASTPFPPPPPDFIGPSLRLAIGIQWLTPGGLDGRKPGAYFRWPEKDIPRNIDLQRMQKEKVFGMNTAGYFLKEALVLLDQRFMCRQAGAAEASALSDSSSATAAAAAVTSVVNMNTSKYSTLELAFKFCNKGSPFIVDTLHAAGCHHVNAAQDALQLYVVFRRAARKHFGEAQGPKIFKPLYEHLIKPVLFRDKEEVVQI